jgi:hypothetical protein
MRRNLIIAAGLMLFCTNLGIAQRTPGAAPASAPASTSAPTRRQVVVPQGFKLIEAGDYKLLLEPSDQEWATQAIKNLVPTTRPSTLPTDVATDLASAREKLIERLVKDLALPDKSDAEKLLSGQLEPDAKFWTEVRPSLVYFITTHKRLVDLKRNGWPEERFYYNRVMDDVTVNRVVDLKSPDDVVLLVEYAPEDPPEKRTQALQSRIHEAESGIYRELTVQTMLSLVGTLRTFIMAHAVAPEQVKEQHNWFIIGVANVLSTQYLAMITGAALDPLMKETINDHPGNPLRSAPIDLLNPADIKDLRPERAGLYIDAYKQKSSRAIYEWLQKAGEDALPKVLTTWRKTPPADGQALLKLIQQTTNFDITPLTKPQ